tara:strand:+ start:1262 stop:1687 length:426 start_codon:yes stop_codon:yes gene_type:complete
MHFPPVSLGGAGLRGTAVVGGVQEKAGATGNQSTEDTDIGAGFTGMNFDEAIGGALGTGSSVVVVIVVAFGRLGNGKSVVARTSDVPNMVSTLVMFAGGGCWIWLVPIFIAVTVATAREPRIRNIAPMIQTAFLLMKGAYL